jgi:hypothetical protein
MARCGVTWNLAYNTPGYKGRHEEAWDYLFALQPELAFVQECMPPADDGGEQIVWKPAFTGGWGSAIVAESLRLMPLDISGYRWLENYEGWVVTAELSEEQNYVVVSVHTSWRPADPDLVADLDALRFPLQGRKGVWPVYLIFDDLRALLESRTFIVGGDLNADPVMDDRPRFVGGNREFFDGLERNGFVNLAAGSGPTHRGYKLDYVFGSRDLSPSGRSSRVDEKAMELGLSDHAPVIVDLELV